VIERDFLSKLERGKGAAGEGTFITKNEGTNPKAFFCVSVGLFSVLGRTVRIRTVRIA
jgi:hypothetical protein